MKATYRVLALAVPALVLVQAAAIAAGTFAILHDADKGHSFTKASAENAGQVVHSFGALVIAAVALVLLIVSFFAKIDAGVKWAALIFLDVIVQFGVAIASFSAPVVGIVHGVNAFVMFGLGMMAATNARRSMVAAPVTTDPVSQPA